MKEVFTIYVKELREVLRDRRTLMLMIVLPTVFMPLLFHIMFSFINKQEKKASEEVIKTALINGEILPELGELFKRSEGFEVVTGFDEAKLTQALKTEEIKLGLVLPKDGADMVTGNYQLEIKAYYDNAAASSKVIRRAQKVIDAYNEESQKDRLITLGVTSALQRKAVIEPVTLVKTGIADKREIIGEQAGGLLPYFFIIFCFVGALYPAIDITAGEKERGTLETLLLTPVPRSYLVVGKFLVVFTSGITSAVLCLASMGAWIHFKAGGLSDEIGLIISSITPGDLFLVAFMLVPLAAIFAALLLTISVYAKNFKEAQSYVTPLNFVIILPAVLAMLPGVELNWGWAMVPVTNIALAIKELVKGTVDYTMLGVIFVSTSLFAGIAFAFCVSWFKREQVLFRN